MVRSTELPSEVIKLLEELERTRDRDILLYKLSDELYTQGTVFYYTFLAFPYLIRIAEQCDDRLKYEIIDDAVFIFNEEEIDSIEYSKKSPIRILFQKELDTLLKLIEEHLQKLNSFSEYLDILLYEILPFKGYPFLYKNFRHFTSSGLFGCCDVCGAEIETYVDEDLDSIKVGLLTDEEQEQGIPIKPKSPECLIGITKWLYETAKEKGFDSIAKDIACIVGTGKCPNCGTEFQVPEYFGITDSFYKSSTDKL